MIRIRPSANSSPFLGHASHNPVEAFKDIYAFFRDPAGTGSGDRRAELDGFDFYMIHGAKSPVLHHAIVHRQSDGAFVVLEGQRTQDSFRDIVDACLPDGDPAEEAQALLDAFKAGIARLYAGDPDAIDDEGVDHRYVRENYLPEMKSLGPAEVEEIKQLYITPLLAGNAPKPAPF